MIRTAIPLWLCIGVAACGPKRLEPDADVACSQCDDWNQPFDPFRIHGNTWYVGTDGLSSLLIETEDGLVLVDGGLPQSAAVIDANIRTLGFDPLDIEAILVSHAHFDHAGGVNALQRLTGAPVYTSVKGAMTLSSGELPQDDPQYGGDLPGFPPIDGVVAVGDREVVTVGSLDVTAIFTPGHTPGGVSWTWESCALGTCYDVVYADSLTSVSAPGFKFSAGAAGQIVESAGVISELDCDILLSPHPFFFGLHDKIEKREDGNPFVNNVACMIYAESMLNWLEQRLDSERR